MHENHRYYLKVLPLSLAGFTIMAIVLSFLGAGTTAWEIVVAALSIATLALLMGGPETPPVVPWSWWRSLTWPKRSAIVCALLWLLITQGNPGADAIAASLPFGESIASVVARGAVLGLMLFTGAITLAVAANTLVWILDAEKALAEKRTRESE